MSVRVRFAPSPTGMLHIGSARSALFNYLFAKHNNGKFLLRIEDTDKERSTEQARQAIIDGLKWLNINWDDEIVYQSKRAERHLEIAKKLIESGNAYYAYDTQEELEEKRKEAEKDGRYFLYKPTEKSLTLKEGVKPVVRLKVPEGKTVFNDIVRGKIEFDNSTIEDMVLIRSDGTPVYMLAVVVDDIDMNITHIIRGDDHISNTPKQILIYNAIGAQTPEFAHIPLIHDIEGKKLSKRRGSVATSEYKNEGYLNEAVFNYLLHLGWNDGTEQEIYSHQEAIEKFDINRIGKSPSRFDTEKLKHINMHYIKLMPDNEFKIKLVNFIEEADQIKLSEKELTKLSILLPELKKLSTLLEAKLSFNPFMDNFEVRLVDEDFSFVAQNKDAVKQIKTALQQESIKENLDKLSKEQNVPMSLIGPLVRLVLIGKRHSFGIYKITETLEKTEIKNRCEKFPT